MAVRSKKKVLIIK